MCESARVHNVTSKGGFHCHTDCAESATTSLRVANPHFLELISIGFVAIGVWMLQSGEDSLIAYASILFFGLGSVALGYMVVAKIKNK